MPIIILDADLKEVEAKKEPVYSDLREKYKYAKTIINREVFKGMFKSEQTENKDSRLVLLSTNRLIINGSTKNGLMNAILYAYNNHKGFRLTPDDLLHCFTTVVARCISDHSDEFRDVFVVSNNSEKKNLTVYSTYDMANMLDSNWEELLSNMSILIDQNVETKIDTVPNFTTSTSCTRTAGNLMKMATFSSYFKLGFMFGCGVRYIDLAGSLEDWLLLVRRVDEISQIFISHGHMVNWCKHFKTILNKLVDTYRCQLDSNELDSGFWQRIITYVPYGSGRQNYISGWAKVLFPGDQYDKYPEYLNLLDSKSEPPKKEDYSYYSWQDEFKKWAQLCEDTPESISEVSAELNNNGATHKLICNIGHLGYELENGDLAVPKIGYYMHIV